MFVAKQGQQVYTGPEIQWLVSQNGTGGLQLRCPLCNDRVQYNPVSSDEPLGYFSHLDGTDCFHSDSVSKAHRLTVEVAVKKLHNRIVAVTGKPVEIDTERWIGTRPNFIIADIRIDSPLRIAAEIYYKTTRLCLRRRLKTMFANDYRTYLIFHTGGTYNVHRVEHYLQKTHPLTVGRFNPETHELSLGDLLSESQIEPSRLSGEDLPNYIRY